MNRALWKKLLSFFFFVIPSRIRKLTFWILSSKVFARLDTAEEVFGMLAGLPLGPLFPPSSLSLSPFILRHAFQSSVFAPYENLPGWRASETDLFQGENASAPAFIVSGTFANMGPRIEEGLRWPSKFRLTLRPSALRRWACYVATENWIVDLYWPIKYSSVRCTTWVLCSSYPDGIWYDLGAPFASWS